MRFLTAFLLLTCAVLTGEIGQVQTVYVLPMSSGLDQYLANRLTAAGVVQVVTDIEKADAIFTDRLGDSLDKHLTETKELKATDKEPNWERPVSQPFSKARGNYFLIDRKTRNVIWSIYERPKNTRPAELNRIASKIAEKFQKDRAPKIVK